MARDLVYEGHLVTLRVPLKVSHEDGSAKTPSDALFVRQQNDEVDPRRDLDNQLTDLVRKAFDSSGIEAQAVRFRKDSVDALIGIATVAPVLMDPADFLVALRVSSEGVGTAVCDYVYRFLNRHDRGSTDVTIGEVCVDLGSGALDAEPPPAIDQMLTLLRAAVIVAVCGITVWVLIL